MKIIKCLPLSANMCEHYSASLNTSQNHLTQARILSCLLVCSALLEQVTGKFGPLQMCSRGVLALDSANIESYTESFDPTIIQRQWKQKKLEIEITIITHQIHVRRNFHMGSFISHNSVNVFLPRQPRAKPSASLLSTASLDAPSLTLHHLHCTCQAQPSSATTYSIVTAF